MNVSDFNTALEEMMVYYDIQKQKFSSPIGSTSDSCRYWRLDGIVEGLQVAWHIFNKTKDIKELKNE